MMVQKSIYEMSDRELFFYKKRLRRQIVMRRRIMCLCMACFLMIIGAVSYKSIKSNAQTDSEDINFKYYTRITVEYGETLWDIANDYIDYEQYKDKEEYIHEVCHINHLDAADDIKAGQYLVVPYYSHEYVE